MTTDVPFLLFAGGVFRWRQDAGLDPLDPLLEIRQDLLRCFIGHFRRSVNPALQSRIDFGQDIRRLERIKCHLALESSTDDVDSAAID